jgi:4-hydroxybenzoate polyprenyltransferase
MNNNMLVQQPAAMVPSVASTEPRGLLYHINTMYLFTKSDFKTVVIPQSIFAIVAVSSLQSFGDERTKSNYSISPEQIVSRIPIMLLWIWLHLLVENISNQRLPDAIAEDAVNKPWRPMPSKRLSQPEAISILRVLTPALLLSTFVFQMGYVPSVTLMAMIWLYNDLDGSGAGPIQRNILNAAGLACFGWGGIYVLLGGEGTSDFEIAGRVPWHWLIFIAMVVATTVHAQDLPDMVGDKARGRQTLPLLYGDCLARYSLAILVLLWSVVCPTFCDVALVYYIPPLCLGMSIAILTVLYREQSYDEMVWKLWCGWFSTLSILPLATRSFLR